MESEEYADYYTDPEADAAVAGAVAAGVIITMLIAALLYVVPAIITLVKLYKKAGQPWWSAIVPIYNLIVMSKIAKRPIWAALGVVGLTVVSNLVGLSDALIALLFAGLFNLGAVGMYVWLLIGFAKQYDRGVGFWVLYVLLPIIAVFLAGKAKYTGGNNVGNQAYASAGPGQAPGAVPGGPAPADQGQAAPTGHDQYAAQPPQTPQAPQAPQTPASSPTYGVPPQQSPQSPPQQPSQSQAPSNGFPADHNQPQPPAGPTA